MRLYDPRVAFDFVARIPRGAFFPRLARQGKRGFARGQGQAPTCACARLDRSSVDRAFDPINPNFSPPHRALPQPSLRQFVPTGLWQECQDH
jgi:hypothetical protein